MHIFIFNHNNHYRELLKAHPHQLFRFGVMSELKARPLSEWNPLRNFMPFGLIAIGSVG